MTRRVAESSRDVRVLTRNGCPNSLLESASRAPSGLQLNEITAASADCRRSLSAARNAAQVIRAFGEKWQRELFAMELTPSSGDSAFRDEMHAVSGTEAGARRARPFAGGPSQGG
jgi:hypothetical protein